MTAPGRQGQALRKLRLRLTLLSAALAGAVLVAMALLSLSLFDGQLRLNGETAFRSNMSAITTKLRSDRILTSEWLAQTEATERLIISISDGGSPLSFPGSWQSGTDRGLLVRQAQDRALSLGVNVNVPPFSILDTTLPSLTSMALKGSGIWPRWRWCPPTEAGRALPFCGTCPPTTSNERFCGSS